MIGKFWREEGEGTAGDISSDKPGLRENSEIGFL